MYPIQPDLLATSLGCGHSLKLYGGDYEFLRAQQPISPAEQPQRTLRAVDLFSGCGGLSLGVREACTEQNLNFELLAAVDNDPAAVSCIQKNLQPRDVISKNVEDVLNKNSEDYDRLIKINHHSGIDLLVAGPPCQGNSDLNNYTRRQDPKNKLYTYVAIAASMLRPNVIISENVLGVRRDKGSSLQETKNSLLAQGYYITEQIVHLADIGVAQRRKRHIVLASKFPIDDIATLLVPFYFDRRNVEWAIGDLEDVIGERIDIRPSTPSSENGRRIRYLFEHDIFELPNDERPPCHRDKKQTYKTIYGRLRWDKPAQTITSGFYSMCMGRYVHPSKLRTLTAREAARLQFFPDYYDFEPAGNRTALSRLIGNAVPPKLSYALASALIKKGAL